MVQQKYINIEIDKLTRSIENSVSGDSFKTIVLEVNAKDKKAFKNQNGYLIGVLNGSKRIKQFTN